MSAVLWFRLPRRIEKSQEARERLTARTDELTDQVARASEVTIRAAARVERAAVELMERHNQALVDAAEELRRK